MQNSIIEQLRKNSRDEIKTTEALRKSAIEAILQSTQQIVDAHNALAKNAEQFKTQKDLDKTFYQPSIVKKSFCDEAARGSTMAQTQAAAQQAAAQASGKVSQKNSPRPPSGGGGASGGSGASPSVNNVIDLSKKTDDQLDLPTRVEQGDDVSDILPYLVNASVPDPISPQDQQTPQGQIDQALNNQRYLRDQTVNAFVKEYLAQKQKTQQGQSVTQLLDDAVFKDGFSSVDFRSSINSMQKEDLLRQAILQTMLRNKFLIERYRLLLRETPVLVSQTAKKVEEYDRSARVEIQSSLRVQ